MTLIEAIIQTGKENLKREGHLVPVFFLFKGDLSVYPPTPIPLHGPDMDEAKTKAVFIIGALARVMGADRVVMIWDAAFRTLKAVKDPQAVMEDPTERPLLYPREMRTECLIINEIQLPSGKDHTTIVPYKGGEGEPVEFLDGSELNKPDLACESRFTKIILAAYGRD
jgi:hypothetical protein